MNIQNCKWIFISAWHWRSYSWKNDVWAIADNWTTEREIVVDVARILLDKLKDYKKAQIIWIWIEEKISLRDKISSINQISQNLNLDFDNSLLIELHCDYKLASPWVSAYYYENSLNSKLFANTIAKSCATVWDREFKWIHSENRSRFGKLWIIHDTTPLACLIEIWSLVWKDLDVLEYMQEELAQSLFEWILEFLSDEEFTNNNNTNMANNTNDWTGLPNYEKDIKILDELSAKISREWHEVESLEAKVILQNINQIILDGIPLINQRAIS